MSTGVIILIVVVAVIVAAALTVAAARPQMRSRRLKQQFGPEYARVVAQHDGNSREAERELENRVTHTGELDIRPLNDAQRERYLAQWATLQEQFVDSPAKAVVDADRLLTDVLRERGYPDDEPYDALSVHHAPALPGFRASRNAAERAPRGEATTEELRDAFVHARATFDALVLDNGVRTAGSSPDSETDRTPAPTTREASA